MTHRILAQGAAAAALAGLIVACGGDKSTPTTPTPAAATLTSPKLDSPAANAQMDSLRPTLTVQNATSDQPSGARTYEFQISDSTSFTSATTSSVIAGFNAQVGKTGVPEGTNGKTSWTPDADLQPTTLFYWRARAVQGSATGPWSDTFTFWSSSCQSVSTAVSVWPASAAARACSKTRSVKPGRRRRPSSARSIAAWSRPVMRRARTRRATSAGM